MIYEFVWCALQAHFDAQQRLSAASAIAGAQGN